jgi:hypothetical protein
MYLTSCADGLIRRNVALNHSYPWSFKCAKCLLYNVLSLKKTTSHFKCLLICVKWRQCTNFMNEMLNNASVLNAAGTQIGPRSSTITDLLISIAAIHTGLFGYACLVTCTRPCYNVHAPFVCNMCSWNSIFSIPLMLHRQSYATIYTWCDTPPICFEIMLKQLQILELVINQNKAINIPFFVEL